MNVAKVNNSSLQFANDRVIVRAAVETEKPKKEILLCIYSSNN